jgi:outer membrane protein assembly factor BamD (BamD/ComL family)
MRRFSILCSIVLVAFIGVAAKIAAQQASPASADNDKVTPAAQKSLVLDSLANEDIVTAEAACRALLNAPTPHALHEIVEEAKALDKLPEVRQLYQNMIAARPGDPQVIWLKMGLAIANIHLGDDNAVEATLQNIAAGHGSDDRVVEAFGQVAWAYRKLNQFDKALSINQYTMDHWPDKGRAAYAQQGIVLCQIGLGDFAAADKALDCLIQKFSGDADGSKLLLWSAFGYDDAGRKDKAQQVYGLVVQNYPQAPEAITAQLRLALAAVEAEDPNRMEQTIQSLLTQFAATQDQGAGLRYLADTLYWKSRAYANGSSQQETLVLIDGYLSAIANYTLATWPASDWALWAQRDLATVAIQQSDDAAAEALFGTMVSEYATHAKLSQALFDLGAAYYDHGTQLWAQESAALPPGEACLLRESPLSAQQSYAKAVERWSFLLQRYPGEPEISPMALYFSAISHSQMGEAGGAVECYQRLLDEWPEQKENQYVLARLPDLYSELVAQGVLTKEQAYTLANEACEQLLTKYPNSASAEMAGRKARYYQTLLEGNTHEE